MHWHEDLQFIYVLEGNIPVETFRIRAVHIQSALERHAGHGVAQRLPGNRRRGKKALIPEKRKKC